MLEAANRKLGRPAIAREVAGIACRDDFTVAMTLSPEDLGRALEKKLRCLWLAGLIYCTGTRGDTELYCTAATLPDPPETFTPSGTSHRKLVLTAVAHAVDRLGRPVRLQDVVDQGHLPGEKLPSRNTTSVYIASLVRSGELTVVGQVSGAGGNNLVVPTGTDVSKLTVKPVPTLNEVVAAAFNQIWQEHVKKGGAVGTRPLPIAGSEVAHRVRWESPLASPTKVRMALKSLTRGRHARVRKVGTGSGSRVRWAPAAVLDEELDLTLSRPAACHSDPERVALLIQRRTERFGVPAASSDQLEQELQLDDEIRLEAHTLAEAITSACPRPESGSTLQNPLVVRAGVVGSLPYYCLPAVAQNAALYLMWLQADHAWTEFNFKGVIQAANRCQLPAYAFAHLARLPYGLREMRTTIDHVLARDALGETVHQAMRSRLNELDDLVERTESELLRSFGTLKSNHSEKIPRWTPERFAKTFQKLSGRAPFDHEVRHPSIRRVRNPEYHSRAAKGRKYSVIWHLDRTSALLFLAESYGGRMCHVLAELARNELAFVRNPQPAITSLHSDDPDQRLTAVACLAFLWSTQGTRHLMTTIEVDPEPGVREAALWAYGFIGGAAAVDLLRQRAAHDTSSRVRQFAALAVEALEHSPTGWWAL
jgi:hypothetical protein